MQQDISDLFGADLPVEGGQGCQFSWCDGPLLLALKSGSWIVLDEVLLLLYSKNVRCQKIKKLLLLNFLKNVCH
jgi:midasin (ATPase involved in ribosome maturation)